jgi:hypothetical protein
VDHIRSGPAELMLSEPLRLNHPTGSNPYNEFLRLLQSIETIRPVTCKAHMELESGFDEWVLLVQTIGRIKRIGDLDLYCDTDSQDFHAFQAVADAVNSAHSLRTLKLRFIIQSETFPRDSLHLTMLLESTRACGMSCELIDALSERPCRSRVFIICSEYCQLVLTSIM